MLGLLKILKTTDVRWIIITVLAGALVYIWVDNKRTKEENVRLETNASSERKYDSIGFAEIQLTKKELKQELQFNRQDLLQMMDSVNIEVRRLRQVVTTKNVYVDTVKRTYIMNELVKAITEKRPLAQPVPFVESTPCLIIAGNLHFDGQDIKLNITNREYANITDVLAVAERVGLRFWKWFRKRKVTVTVLNSCGETHTRIIKLKK